MMAKYTNLRALSLDIRKIIKNKKKTNGKVRQGTFSKKISVPTVSCSVWLLR